MKVIAAFFSAFIFIALIVLLITSLADIPEEALRLRLIPKLSDPLLILLSSVVGLFFLGTLAGAAGFLVSRRKSGAARKQTRKDLGFFHVIAFIVVSAALILFILALIISLIDYPEEDELKGQGRQPEEGEGEETDEAREDEQQGETWENGSRGPRGVPDLERRNRIIRLLVISAGAVLFIIILLFSVRLFRSPLPSNASEEKEAGKLRRELARAARISLDDIRNNSNYRVAVIACYARMEEVLNRHGFKRLLQQTPLEYMKETLRRAGSSGNTALPKETLLNLTRLFEIAKFSTHEVDRDDRDEAIARLTGLIDILSAGFKA
jgi:hypothetical protein